MLSIELADFDPLEFNEISFSKRKKTPTERFYHAIKVNHHGNILYPGRFGHTKKDEKACGKFKSAYSCLCGDSKEVFLHSCNNINCPKCYINSIIASSERATDRFNHIIKFLRTRGFTRTYLRHIAIAIKPVQITDYHDLVKVRNKVRNILKKYGFSGLLIFHPYRINKYASPKELVYSPHFHFFGHCWIPNNFYKKHGFIVTHIRWLYNSKSVYNSIKYVLTHAGYFYKKHILTWFGHYSYAKLVKINEYKDSEPALCETCEDNIYKVDLPEDMIEMIIQMKRSIILPRNWSLYLNLDFTLKKYTKYYEFSYKKSDCFRRRKIKKKKSTIIKT